MISIGYRAKTDDHETKHYHDRHHQKIAEKCRMDYGSRHLHRSADLSLPRHSDRRYFASHRHSKQRKLARSYNKLSVRSSALLISTYHQTTPQICLSSSDPLDSYQDDIFWKASYKLSLFEP